MYLCQGRLRGGRGNGTYPFEEFLPKWRSQNCVNQDVRIILGNRIRACPRVNFDRIIETGFFQYGSDDFGRAANDLVVLVEEIVGWPVFGYYPQILCIRGRA